MVQRNGTVSILDLIGKIPLLLWRSWIFLKINSNPNIRIGSSVKIYEGFKVILPHIEVGQGTQLNKNFYARGSYPVKIGKYCGFGEDVRIITGNHRMDRPALSIILVDKSFGGIRHGKGGSVNIGNDVWVGDRAIMLPGVNVGNGAVIGAGAIVNRDVPPYAVVAGCPASVKKYRFPEKTIEKLLALKWWDWPKEKRLKNKEFFLTNLNEQPEILECVKE